MTTANVLMTHILHHLFLLIAVVVGTAGAAPSDYATWRSLSHERQAELAPALEPKAFRKLPNKERQEISHAALLFSKDAIGRLPNGILKTVKNETEKHLLRIAGDYLNKLPPNKVSAHPRAGELFGNIPEGAQRVDHTLKIDPTSERWHSTGLYAALARW